MKNRKAIYILIPAVLLIWALIAYQVSEGLQGGAPTYAGAGVSLADVAPDEADTFTYTLMLHYPDPFLGRVGYTNKAVPAIQDVPAAQRSPAINSKEEKQPQKPDLSIYKYIGVVEHKSKKDKLALLSVGGRSVMLREGESVEEVKLLKISPDSVKLMKGVETFYIRR
jgi:hypothetical protein